jgi:2-C-methyl-D-erythritol 4-phosphate cytidylyltransferase/2-C-methyl-D-erythritol 2,4-cyclodiphosphate synthase
MNPASELSPEYEPTLDEPGSSTAAGSTFDISGTEASGGLAPTRAIIVVAAGSGQRLGAERPKAFVTLAGRSILEHCLDGVFGMHEAAQVIVVAPAALVPEAEEIAFGAAGAARDYVSVVSGGATRQESVHAGLGLLLESVQTVLVHDAARALATSDHLERVAALVEQTGGGVVPGLAVADTIKSVDAHETITGTVDRSALRAVQTPQGFPREQILAAYAAGGDDHTDDAALCAAHGFSSIVVAGDPLAFKITTPWDLQRAERLLAERAEAAALASGGTTPALRSGLGIDVHAFDDDQPLWLAGLHWPGEPGLSGHSDGDAVAHAIVDAVLSAAGLGDIGGMFGTDDPRFDGAHGSVFLEAAIERVREAGYRVESVTAQIVGNRPRFSPRRAEAEELLTALVGAPVSLSATTTDGLGFTGRGEGVAAIATALLSDIRASSAARPVV